VQDLKLLNFFIPLPIPFQLNLNTNTERVNSLNVCSIVYNVNENNDVMKCLTHRNCIFWVIKINSESLTTYSSHDQSSYTRGVLNCFQLYYIFNNIKQQQQALNINKPGTNINLNNVIQIQNTPVFNLRGERSAEHCSSDGCRVASFVYRSQLKY